VPVRLWTVKALSHGSIGGTGYSMDRIFLSKRQKKTMVSGCVMDWKATVLYQKSAYTFQFITSSHQKLVIFKLGLNTEGAIIISIALGVSL
jgi:hypothetical protein